MKQRHFLGKREAKKFLKKISEKFGEIEAKEIEFAKFEDYIIYILDNKIEILEKKGLIYPFLGGKIINKVPSVIIDMGAIRFVCNGADIMAPGIIDLEDFPDGKIVVIRDVKHGKPLAVGMALKPSENIKLQKKGKVISNIHYVGDKLWNELN
jgi:PUA domain protein